MSADEAMYLDGQARLTRRKVLEDALDVLRSGRDPENESEFEESLIAVLEATHEITVWSEEDGRERQRSRNCRCPQCETTVRLAQAILETFDRSPSSQKEKK